MDPKTLRYATTHEWASLDGDVCTVGITQFAVDQLTDVVYIDLPDVGDHALPAKDRSARSNRSRRSATCTRRSTARSSRSTSKLKNDPGRRSQRDPYGKGWLIKIKVEPGTTLDH